MILVPLYMTGNRGYFLATGGEPNIPKSSPSRGDQRTLIAEALTSIKLLKISSFLLSKQPPNSLLSSSLNYYKMKLGLLNSIQHLTKSNSVYFRSPPPSGAQTWVKGLLYLSKYSFR
jgi:hypothetical protein